MNDQIHLRMVFLDIGHGPIGAAVSYGPNFSRRRTHGLVTFSSTFELLLAMQSRDHYGKCHKLSVRMSYCSRVWYELHTKAGRTFVAVQRGKYCRREIRYSLFTHSNLLRRNTSHNRPRQNRFCNNGASTNDRSFTDGHAFEYRYTGPNPDIVVNLHWRGY